MTVTAEGLRQTASTGVLQTPALATRVVKTLRRHPRLGVGGTIVLLLLFVAVFAPLLTHYDPIVGDISQSLDPPSATHWFGTDDQGRDVFARVLYGARLSLSVAVISVAIGVIL